MREGFGRLLAPHRAVWVGDPNQIAPCVVCQLSGATGRIGDGGDPIPHERNCGVAEDCFQAHRVNYLDEFAVGIVLVARFIAVAVSDQLKLALGVEQELRLVLQSAAEGSAGELLKGRKVSGPWNCPPDIIGT